MDLKEELKQYRDISIEIMNKLNNNLFDEILPLIDNRQEIIDKIEKGNIHMDEFLKIARVFELNELEKKLENLMRNKSDYIRTKLESTTKNQMVNNSYNRGIENSIIFSKKI